MPFARRDRARAEYQAALGRYDISEGDLRGHLLGGYRMLRFTDLRFRPDVQVADADLREFYQLLAAGWRRNPGGQVPTYEESREQVQKKLCKNYNVVALMR